jgi:hypothetical protein
MDLNRVLRESLAKVGSGLLYGVGFGISVGAIYYFITEKQMESFWDRGVENVVVKAHEKVARDSSVVVLGTLENQGTESVRTMHIQVDLFDKNEKFVDQCHTYLTDVLKAGETRNFKVSCGDRKTPVVDHATYKVRVGGMM